MDTIRAKMFVRSANTSAARILIAFILARSALDVKQLRDWTGMKRETIYNALNTLSVFGLVEKQILAHGRVVWLPAGDLLPGFQMSAQGTPAELQMSVQGTSELQESALGTPTIGGGESINLTLNTDSLNPPTSQMSAQGTSGIPSLADVLRHTDKLFDGAQVSSKGIDDRDPLQALAWCAYAYVHKSKLHGRPGGVVHNRLKDNQPAPEWARLQWRETLPADFLEDLGLMEYTCQVCQTTFQKMDELGAHQATHPKRFVCPICQEIFDQEIDLDAHFDETHRPKPLVADESVTVPIYGSMTAERAWQSVLGQLEMEMPRASFDTWVRDSKAARYGRNTLSIGVRNAYARDWLESRLRSTVERLLVGILNASVTVEFVVADTEPSEAGE